MTRAAPSGGYSVSDCTWSPAPTRRNPSKFASRFACQFYFSIFGTWLKLWCVAGPTANAPYIKRGRSTRQPFGLPGSFLTPSADISPKHPILGMISGRRPLPHYPFLSPSILQTPPFLTLLASRTIGAYREKKRNGKPPTTSPTPKVVACSGTSHRPFPGSLTRSTLRRRTSRECTRAHSSPSQAIATLLYTGIGLSFDVFDDQIVLSQR